jgi:murein DD-endopeptidase MepM/ murein hydrolase activator NlpD
MVHLRKASVQVSVGDVVAAGDQLAECGNSGNSTQPCVHLQVTDSIDWRAARGIPMLFRSYRSVDAGSTVQGGMPGEREVIEPA